MAEASFGSGREFQAAKAPAEGFACMCFAGWALIGGF
jgi:hypothetical protein